MTEQLNSEYLCKGVEAGLAEVEVKLCWRLLWGHTELDMTEVT